MFVPLSHPPGHAQCDFGEALVVINGVELKAHCFILDLPHSDGCFVKAYPAETQGHSIVRSGIHKGCYYLWARRATQGQPSWLPVGAAIGHQQLNDPESAPLRSPGGVGQRGPESGLPQGRVQAS